LTFVGGPPYIHRLTDEYIATFIRRLTNKYRGLWSLVPGILLDFGTEGYKKPRKILCFPIVYAHNLASKWA
jgi:hypothetical protein